MYFDGKMTNNIRDLRIAFLLSPREFARRIGIYPEYVARLENGARPLSDIWIDAVSRALCVSREVITDPQADFNEIAANAVRPPDRCPILCPIGARSAIQALTGKLGGVKLAAEISEDELADAVQSLVAYVDDDGDALFTNEKTKRSRVNRLSKGLQITVLTILQSRAIDLPPDAQVILQKSLPGAVSLLEVFSQVDHSARHPGR